MTNAQREKIAEIIAVAEGHWTIKSVNERDMSEESKTAKFVSLAIWFGNDCPRNRRTVHLFVGPRGGVTYPVQVKKGRQVCKKFNWDFLEVMDDQEAGWKRYLEEL